MQYQLDNQITPTVDPDIDPRPKLKILRLIMCAGVQTPEKDHHHRKRQGTIQCSCGNGSPTIHHISWECKCFKDIRDELWQYMPRPKPLNSVPTCFRLTTLVPLGMNITEEQVMGIQNALVKIWQKHVQMWYGTTDSHDTPPFNNPDAPTNTTSENNLASSSTTPTAPSAPAIKRGHVLKLIPEGGVFCCRCGKQTKNQKHQRLKILNEPCRYPDLDPSQWLTTPGFNNSVNRIQEAERMINEKYNSGKHELIWNRKVGKIKNKADYGLIWCSLCGRTWPWAHRMNNLSRTVCHPTQDKPDPPSWVTLLRSLHLHSTTRTYTQSQSSRCACEKANRW